MQSLNKKQTELGEHNQYNLEPFLQGESKWYWLARYFTKWHILDEDGSRSQVVILNWDMSNWTHGSIVHSGLSML